MLMMRRERRHRLTGRKKRPTRIYGLLPEEQGKMLYDLWIEFEAQKTPEAKFARVMDNLQPMMLNAATDGKAMGRTRGASGTDYEA